MKFFSLIIVKYLYNIFDFASYLTNPKIFIVWPFSEKNLLISGLYPWNKGKLEKKIS